VPVYLPLNADADGGAVPSFAWCSTGNFSMQHFVSAALLAECTCRSRLIRMEGVLLVRQPGWAAASLHHPGHLTQCTRCSSTAAPRGSVHPFLALECHTAAGAIMVAAAPPAAAAAGSMTQTSCSSSWLRSRHCCIRTLRMQQQEGLPYLACPLLFHQHAPQHWAQQP